MKILDANIIDELAKLQASEPLTIIGVQWVDVLEPAGRFTPAKLVPGPWVLYSDKELPGVHGKIMNVGSIDHQLSYTSINSSNVDVTLSDIDGLVKGYYDSNDLHKRKCFIWQYFGGLNINDRFVIFQGLTNSPITWSEGDRTIHFSLLSEVEDKEVGFSPEEAQYDYISPDSVGQAWPLCFGDPIHVPAVKVRTTPTGTLKTKLSIVDVTLRYKIDAIINAYFQEIFLYNYYKSIAAKLQTLVLELRIETAAHVRYVSQVIDNTGDAPVEAITAVYCYLIGAEDDVNRRLVDLTESLTTKKQELELKKAGKIPWGNRTPKQTRQDLKDIRDKIKQGKVSLKEIVKAKKITEQYIDFAEYQLNVQRKAFQEQTKCFNNILELYAQYNDVLNEFCLQRKTEVTSVVVEHGEDFPQNVTMDLLINDMRVRGSFNDTVFNIDVLLPKYRNIPLGPRQNLTNECGVYDYQEGINKFFIKDSTYSLAQWALVRASNGQKHIIKIEEQEGVKCTYKLVQPPDDQSGHGGSRQPQNLFASTVGFPLFGGPNVPNATVYPIYNTPNGQIEPLDYVNNNIFSSNFNQNIQRALRQYNVDPLDPDEIFNFQRLYKMFTADVAEDYIWFQAVRPRDVYNLVGEDIVQILENAATPMASWLTSDIDFSEVEEGAWEAAVGTTVSDFNNPYEIYVANIVPSDVKCVMAHKVNEFGETKLDIVPLQYYTLNEAEDLGDLTVTSLKFNIPLSSRHGEGWDDNIYVTLSSSIDSNTVVQLKWLIEHYTDKTWDATTFNHVQTLFGTKYPSNFALFDRKNVLSQLQDIAFQARCMLILIDEIFYLYYLAEEPESVRTITNEDIEVNSLTLGYSETESLVTKLTALWKRDYLPETKTEKIVLRHNIHRYGLHEQDYNFYIYNIRSLVLKSATFWLIRWANTWKKVEFHTFLKHLDLELNDCITFDCTQVAPTKAVIDHIVYDIDNHSLVFSCWLPIKAGGNTQYPFAWPADAELTFPSVDDDAGGSRWALAPVKGE